MCQLTAPRPRPRHSRGSLERPRFDLNEALLANGREKGECLPAAYWRVGFPEPGEKVQAGPGVAFLQDGRDLFLAHCRPLKRLVSGWHGWHALRYSEGRADRARASHALRSTSGRATRHGDSHMSMTCLRARGPYPFGTYHTQTVTWWPAPVRSLSDCVICTTSPDTDSQPLIDVVFRAGLEQRLAMPGNEGKDFQPFLHRRPLRKKPRWCYFYEAPALAGEGKCPAA